MSKYKIPNGVELAPFRDRIKDYDRWLESQAELEATRDQLQASVDAMEADTKFPVEADGQLLAAKREQIGMCNARIERCEQALQQLAQVVFPADARALDMALSACAGEELDQAQKLFLKAVSPFMASINRAERMFMQTDYVSALRGTTSHGTSARWALVEMLDALERYQDTGSILATKGESNWKVRLA